MQSLRNTGLVKEEDRKGGRVAEALKLKKRAKSKKINLKNKCISGLESSRVKHSKNITMHCKGNVEEKNKNKEDRKVKTFNKLSCFYVNARSIMNKKDELELYLIQEKPDIVGITETWLYEEIEDTEISAEGYTVFRKDREKGDKSRGGGVIILAKNELYMSIKEEMTANEFPESIWYEIKSGRVKTLMGVCYRPPSSLKINDDALFELMSKACRENVLIMGDFNWSELDWTRPETLADTHPFVKCMNDNFLFQTVTEGTRGKSILDLVLVTEETMIENLRVGEPFGTSDHQIIRWDFLINEEINKMKNETLNYFKADYDAMREEVEKRGWEGLVKGLDVELDWNNLKVELIELRNKFIPVQKSKGGKSKWVTKMVIRRRRAKIKAWNKYVNSGKAAEMHEKYKAKLKIAQKENENAKRYYEQNLAANIKKDSKSFFAYIRSKQRTKDNVGPLKDSIGRIITDDREAANILNEYFSSVFTTEDCAHIPVPGKLFQKNIEEGLISVEITEEMVSEKLQKININKCPGVDEIHPKMLLELKAYLVKPLTSIFKTSLEQGIVPLDWKDAGIVPLFKKGKRDDPKNYRPISLTSIIGKILESIIKDSMLEHLEQHKLIRDSQHGFTRGRSCLTNLIDFMEVVTSMLDEGDPVDMVYLDFAKAFDKVPHQRLLRKLEAHGVGGKVCEWVKNWIMGRRQKVGLNRNYSEWQSVLSGVPQGSVLGPLLFLIYINDLDVNINSKLSKFADDTKMCRTSNNDKEAATLQNDLHKIYQWSLDWQMLFNIDKCVVIHAGNNNKRYNYTMGDSEIRKSTKERDLGIMVESSGKVTEQCVMAAKKANVALGLIKRNIHCKSKDVIVRLYKALVRPKLEYCVQAWCPYLKKDIDILERVQKRATKMIGGLRNVKYEDRLVSTGLLPLDKRRVRGDLIQVFKFINNIDKIEYRKLFEMSDTSRPNTRGHSQKLVKKRSRLELRKNFFSQRVVNAWNGLPQSVVDAESVNSFKNKLDKIDKYWK